MDGQLAAATSACRGGAASGVTTPHRGSRSGQRSQRPYHGAPTAAASS